METDTQEAYDNFMSSTGFANTNRVPTMGTGGRNTPLSAGKTTKGFEHHYNRSNPQAPPLVPGQLGMFSRKGKITPEDGLVPGHLPPSDQMNPTLMKQDTPYPESDLLSATKPFSVHNSQRTQDWRAVGVGPVSDRRGPGKVAKSPPNQGYLTPTFTGKYKKTYKGADGPFPRESKMEKMMAGNNMYGVYFFGVGTAVSVTAWLRDYGAMWCLVALILFALTIYSYKNHEAEMGGNSEKMAGHIDKNAITYHANHKETPLDTSRKQVYQPRKRGMKDSSPYPKPLDSETDTATRLKAQGLDQSNVEGPRSDYWYKRGPTPGNRQRLKSDALMRSANQVNMNERELDEYMTRLDGLAPDNFYQVHPYMPFSAFWDHRQQINDPETVHGISTEPGTYGRKWFYKDPKIQQGGAKTMHTKEPPPGSLQPLDKVHPWTEPSELMYGEPFDMDQYTEFVQGHSTKVDKMTGGKIASSRAQEDEVIRNMYGRVDKNPDDLPLELQPVPTSREGQAAQIHARNRKYAMQMANQTDRQLHYMANVQGGAYGVAPPHPAAPRQAPPVGYGNMPPYPTKYAPPNQMPAPNLRGRPRPDMVATPPMNAKERADKEFAAAFAPSSVDDDDVQAAIRDVKRR